MKSEVVRQVYDISSDDARMRDQPAVPAAE